MIVVAIILGGLIATLVFVSPRWGSYLVWSAVWLYPTSLLHGALPLDIRFSDLFVVLLTIACIRVAPPDVLASRGFRMAFLWFLSLFIANLIGILTGPAYILRSVLKEVGKAAYIPMIAYVLCTLVRDERELRRHMVAVTVAAVGAILLGIIQVYSPRLVAIWEVPADPLRRTVSEAAGYSVEATRRAGGVTSAGVLGIITTFTTLVAMRIAVNRSEMKTRLVYGGVCLFGLLGLGYTVTRGAIAGLAAALLYGTIRFSRRFLAITTMSLLLLFIVTETDLSERLRHRIVGEAGQARIEQSASYRAELWTGYLKEWSFHYFLFGRGITAEFVRHHGTAHSSYVGALAYTGLFGTGVLIWLIVRAWRTGWQLVRADPDSFSRALGEALVLTIIALLVYGVASGLWQKPQMFLFGLIVLVDSRLRMLERGEVWVSPADQGRDPGLAGANFTRPAAWQ